MKIAVDFGHGVPYDDGAIGILDEEKVIREYGQLVISKLQVLGHKVLNVTPSTATSLGNSLAQRTTAANNFGADLFVSCHANSFSMASANGCEVEYLSPAGKIYADKIVNEIAKLGYANRGSVLRKDLYVINHTSMPAIIIEPLFVTNSADCKRYNAEYISNATVKGITGQTVEPPKITILEITAQALCFKDPSTVLAAFKKGDQITAYSVETINGIDYWLIDYHGTKGYVPAGNSIYK